MIKAVLVEIAKETLLSCTREIAAKLGETYGKRAARAVSPPRRSPSKPKPKPRPPKRPPKY